MVCRLLLPCLLALPLAAQGATGLTLDLRTSLGSDPEGRIQLVHPGDWSAWTPRPLRPVRRPPPGTPGATVEVVDMLPPEIRRAEALARFRLDLHRRLEQAFRTPPPDNASVDLALLMRTDPAHPETGGLAMVRSLQDRFNPPPSDGMPVPER